MTSIKANKPTKIDRNNLQKCNEIYTGEKEYKEHKISNILAKMRRHLVATC